MPDPGRIPDRDEAATAVAVLDDDGLARFLERELRARGADPDGQYPCCGALVLNGHWPDCPGDAWDGVPAWQYRPMNPGGDPGPTPDPDDDVVRRLELLPGAVDSSGWPRALTPTDWSGRENVPAPDLLWSDDLGHGLIYGHEINWLVGAPGCGKTWLLLHACIEAVAAERRVLWLEGSGDRNPLPERLTLLGCPEVIDGIQHLPSDTWAEAEPEDRAAAIDWLAEGLLVIDSATSTGCGETAEAFTAWRRLYLPEGRYGAIVADHSPKRLVDGQRLPRRDRHRLQAHHRRVLTVHLWHAVEPPR